MFDKQARMTGGSTPLWQLLVSDFVLVALAVCLAPIGFDGHSHHFASKLHSIRSAWFWTMAAVGVAGYHIYLTPLELT